MAEREDSGPETPARAFRVVCDSMLQGLARSLRCLGADVRVLGTGEDHRRAAEVSAVGPGPPPRVLWDLPWCSCHVDPAPGQRAGLRWAGGGAWTVSPVAARHLGSAGGGPPGSWRSGPDAGSPRGVPHPPPPLVLRPLERPHGGRGAVRAPAPGALEKY